MRADLFLIYDCKDKGFKEDYTKEDTYYSAKNKNNYELTINLNYNVMNIYIEVPESEEESEDIDDDKLSAADYAYYIEVNTRIQKKLADSVK